MIDLSAAANSTQNKIFLILQFRRDNQPDRFTENLRRREAEHSLGRWVPRGDDTVQVLANDGIIGAGNNRREESLQTLLLRDIPGNFGSANHAPGGVSDRRHR